ncbi:response regulator containing an adenylate cyclase effector domain (plasmid) [Cupriavidus necator N-1]|uniref:Adenylate cyclase n=1 Tax=Cupriavidus necator (strain ATCC 43291 / DSM 13513 / CCUG 52238 / LMG 8453 / N-1) TaxID=1042878 RepID=F8GU66_CUPNN|nr:adenylate/guanylate cyclase domain-containing protein [Cupriavidus necator]AEI82270.1 response regulator containing an adenylate cyclase effector domain [Cupriavidus necator N-1]MDX6007290.1 adenylate/guanylate cyclase domain-containing protein [Cupriavidus necator]
MLSLSDILGARILIVDDLEANVLLLEQMLRGAGYTCVMSTTDPRVVSELHRKSRYDLILLDLQMPSLDGFQVMDALKEVEPESYLPVIVITAQSDHKLRALQAGAKDFVSKPFDLAEVLMRVHNMLEVRLLHRESLKYGKALEQKVRELEASRETIVRQSDELKRLYEKLLHEQQVSERLLLTLLPSPIAERLKARSELIAASPPEVIADNFQEVSVLFADIVQFTRFSAGMSPNGLVAVLNEIFADFDNIADRRGLEKIKTIGDAYMAASGLPMPADDHAERAAHMGLDMIESLEEFSKRSGHSLQLRVGINSGAVVAGVIGRRKFIYDLWGDAVNIASRMESHGVAGRVQVTEATRQRLGKSFKVEERGTIAAKGLGELRTWFLIGRTGNAPD